MKFDFAHCPEQGPKCPESCPGRMAVHVCHQIAAGIPKWRRLAEQRINGTVIDAGPLIPNGDFGRLNRMVKACPFRSTVGCGCSGAKCALRGEDVPGQTCLECVKTYGW